MKAKKTTVTNILFLSFYNIFPRLNEVLILYFLHKKYFTLYRIRQKTNGGRAGFPSGSGFNLENNRIQGRIQCLITCYVIY